MGSINENQIGLITSKTLSKVGISLDKKERGSNQLNGDFGQISFYNQSTISKFTGNMVLSNEKNTKYYLYICREQEFIVQDEKKKLNLRCDLRAIQEPIYLFFMVGPNNKMKVSFNK